MPSYPAKPHLVPYDDWFNNTSNFGNDSKSKEIKNISTIHEFFYRQSHVKVGGSDNLIQTKFEKKSSAKIISSLRNFDESVISRSEEKHSYSRIPTEIKFIKKRSFQRKTFYRNLFVKNIFNFRSYLSDLKSVFIKIIRRKKEA